jgi:hypothetical protein
MEPGSRMLDRIARPVLALIANQALRVRAGAVELAGAARSRRRYASRMGNSALRRSVVRAAENH